MSFLMFLFSFLIYISLKRWKKIYLIVFFLLILNSLSFSTKLKTNLIVFTIKSNEKKKNTTSYLKVSYCSHRRYILPRLALKCPFSSQYRMHFGGLLLRWPQLVTVIWGIQHYVVCLIIVCSSTHVLKKKPFYFYILKILSFLLIFNFCFVNRRKL